MSLFKMSSYKGLVAFTFALALCSFSPILVGACENNIKPNLKDCNSYIICLHGEEVVLKCPAGLEFNKEQKVCDWPDNSNCKVGSTVPNEQENEVGVDLTTTTTIAPIIPHGESPRFAPYFDVTLPGPSLSEVAEKTGQLDFTLAFALGSNAGCVPKWGGEKDLNDTKIIEEIRKIQAKNGQVIVALGGAVGPYLEHMCSTIDTLFKAYILVLDTVRTNHLDVDVEAPIPLDIVNRALAKVQKERPTTTVSYTLMIQGENFGLNPELGIKTLENAKSNGVKVEIVNAMTMEFGGESSDWGDSVIGAAESVLKQMKNIYPEKSASELRRMLGVTPMLGRNFNGKRFTPMHGKKLVDWANMNRIGLLSFWSIGRDNGNCANGPIKPDCSSIAQSDYEFTKLFQAFKS